MGKTEIGLKEIIAALRRYERRDALLKQEYPEIWESLSTKLTPGRPKKSPSTKKPKPQIRGVQGPENPARIKSVTKKKAVKKQSKNSDSHLTAELIAHWCDEYRAVYGSKPPLPGKQVGVLRRLHKDFGLEQAKLYLEAYLRIKEQWYVKKRHSLDQLENNLNAVEQFISNGKIITSKTAQQIETDQYNQAAMEAASNDGSIPF